MLKLAQARGVRGADIDVELEETYLSLINCLVLVEEKMRWLLVRPIEMDGSSKKRTRFAVQGIDGEGEGGIKRGTRRVVTVEDVRREYQGHLDRMADWKAGRYPLLLDDGGVDEDEDEVMEVEAPSDGEDDVVMAGALMPPGGTGMGTGMEVDVFAA